MDINELLNIIKKGEDSKTQFKSKVDSINALAAEMCAFANSEGGYLIIGVDDNGSITGVQDVKSLNQWIANAANQKIEPPIDVTTENVLYEDKVVVVIKVPAGYNKPYAANKTEFWVKVGSDNRRATREELQRLMQASGDIYADEMPIAGTSIEDIDFYYFKNFYE
ncbi:MAG: ATP-binding protein, partial [Thermoanaerobacteraceae bacterium]|nr:ATP-binding protein [Thermoanaerobacteraceae bacterium]